MRINYRKSRKFSGGFGQHLVTFLKPFALQKHWDASAWKQHTYIYLIQKNNQGFFLYYISCK
jgi:hypothetical protein